MKNQGLLRCSRKCMELKTSCPVTECRHWLDYEDDYNCTLIAIYEHGPMTLREIAERLHLSFARIKQIETKAIAKIKKKAMGINSFF